VRGARPERALEADIDAALAASPDETLLAAVSGGPDSAALAALAARHAAARGARLILGHVNHGLRPSAERDEGVTLALGAALGLRVLVRVLPPGAAAEARLRDARYAALAGLAREVGAARILTAHHAEDQSESVLLALFRGSGPAGLAGIPARRRLADGIELQRPLLGVSRARLTAHCAALHLPYAFDPTNAELGYRRNAVRAALATLRPSFPELDAAIARYAAIARAERDGDRHAVLRRRLRAGLADSLGDVREITFERLESLARAVETGRPGRHFVRRNVELIVRPPR
jgi:tRNA(Ile)-lysidine synthase